MCKDPKASNALNGNSIVFIEKILIYDRIVLS